MSEENTPTNNLETKNESQNNESVSNSPADFYQISSVRTYKGDVSQTVKGDKINTAKILIAEQKRKEKEDLKTSSYSIENNTNKFKLFFGVLFTAVAIVAIAYAIMNFWQPRSKVEQNIVLNNTGKLFVVDKTKSFDVSNKSREEIEAFLKDFLNTKFTENSVNEVVFYQTIIDGTEKVEKVLNSASVLNLLKIAPPDILKRSLTNDYVVGTYTFDSKNNKFIIFKLADFANTYDSMFSYEKDLVDDMRDFFGGFPEFDSLSELRRKKVDLLPTSIESSKATTTIATSTSSSTKPKTNEEEIKNIDAEMEKMEKIIYTYKNFIDIVLQNNDSRAIVDKDSNVLFYYTFIDREWILFANNIEVLKEVKRRIREKNLAR
jgi:hypothetical protein